jgi:hypothetical protein
MLQHRALVGRVTLLWRCLTACRPNLQPGTQLEVNFMGRLVPLDLPMPGQPQAHDARSASSPRIPRYTVRLLLSLPLLLKTNRS